MSIHSKRKFILLSLILILPFNSMLAFNDPDSSKNQFYVKSIINQVNVGYTHELSPVVSFSIEGGYQFNYLKDWHFKGTVIPVELIYKNLAYSGFSLRFGPEIRFSESWGISPLVGYQNLYTGKIIYDPGAFGGVSDASYSEYSQKINELVAQVLFSKQDPDIPVQFYFGLGIRFQHLSNSYSIEGRVDKKQPSDRKESYWVTRFPAIILGMKFFFAWF